MLRQLDSIRILNVPELAQRLDCIQLSAFDLMLIPEMTYGTITGLDRNLTQKAYAKSKGAQKSNKVFDRFL